MVELFVSYRFARKHRMSFGFNDNRERPFVSEGCKRLWCQLTISARIASDTKHRALQFKKPLNP
jgi:hypothetical protein